jgi:chorismate mutase-like protein
MASTLEQLRAEIDRLDEQILPLLNRRAALAVDIGRLKHAAGAQLYVPERERAVLARLVTHNSGPLSHRSVCRIFGEVMAASLALEDRQTVVAAGAAPDVLTAAVAYAAGPEAKVTHADSIEAAVAAFTADPACVLVVGASWASAHGAAIAAQGGDWRGCWCLPVEGQPVLHVFAHRGASLPHNRPATLAMVLDAQSLAAGVPPAWLATIPARSIDVAGVSPDGKAALVLAKLEMNARDAAAAWLSGIAPHCQALWILS